MKSFLVSILLCASCATFSQPASRSVFFVENEGQWPGEFAFRYDGGGGSWFVTNQGMTIDLKQYERDPLARKDFNAFAMHDERENKHPTRIKGHVLKANLVNAYAPQSSVAAHSCVPLLEGSDKLTSYSNYFLGKDKSKWRSRVGHYLKVVAKEVWAGIDVEYEAKKQGVETFFRVQPGADISQIQIEYEGLEAPLSVDNKGNLILKTSLGSLIEKAPFAYQIENRRQREVSVQFELTSDNSYTLNVPNYNHDRELVIDPFLYGTYLGGPGLEEASDVSVDSNGEFVVCGSNNADGFPITPGSYQTEAVGWHGFITRFNSDGTDLVFSTYLGSPNPIQGDQGSLQSICFIDSGRIVCGGYTEDIEWPVTENAIQDEIATTTYADAVLNILSADGSELVYGTYMGSSYTDNCRDIVYDGSDMIYCCGEAGHGEIVFPITPDAIFSEPGNVPNSYLLRLNIHTYTLEYSTLLPSDDSWIRASSLVLRESNIIWMSGTSPARDLPVTANAIQPEKNNPDEYNYDGFITRWDLNSNELSYCSYWGGGRNDATVSIAAINDSLIVIGGGTASADFPTTEGVLEPVEPDTTEEFYNSFVTVMNPYESILASTYFGVMSQTTGFAKISVDSAGISFFGKTSGQGIPLSPNAYDTLLNDIGSPQVADIYLARLSPDLRYLEYGSYLGGGGPEEGLGGCFDNNGNAWICGTTWSGNLPTTEGAFDREYGAVGDGFVIQFNIPDLDTPISIHPIIPDKYSLSIFPNPFNPSTTISFNLPHRAQTSLEIFNLLGQSVYSIDLGRLEAGSHQHHLNAAALPSGSYLTRLDAGDMQDVKRMVLIR